MSEPLVQNEVAPGRGNGLAQPTLRVIVVDDHDGYRAGLIRTLTAHPEIVVVAEAADGVAGVEAILEHRPDIALVDYRMPRGDGLEVLERVRRAAPGCLVLILSAEAHDLRERALAAGAAAVLGKELSRPQILQTLLRLVPPG